MMRGLIYTSSKFLFVFAIAICFITCKKDANTSDLKLADPHIKIPKNLNLSYNSEGTPNGSWNAITKFSPANFNYYNELVDYRTEIRFYKSQVTFILDSLVNNRSTDTTLTGIYWISENYQNQAIQYESRSGSYKPQIGILKNISEAIIINGDSSIPSYTYVCSPKFPTLIRDELNGITVPTKFNSNEDYVIPISKSTNWDQIEVTVYDSWSQTSFCKKANKVDSCITFSKSDLAGLWGIPIRKGFTLNIVYCKYNGQSIDDKNFLYITLSSCQKTVILD